MLTFTCAAKPGLIAAALCGAVLFLTPCGAISQSGGKPGQEQKPAKPDAKKPEPKKSEPQAEPKKPRISDPLLARAEDILAKLDERAAWRDSKALPAACEQLESLWCYAIAYYPEKGASKKHEDALRSLAQSRRLLAYMSQCGGDRAGIYALLRSSPKLSAALLFLINPEYDKPGEVLGVLDALRRTESDGKKAAVRDLEKYANLAAAVCVVFDKPPKYKLNENVSNAPRAEEVFDFFARTEANTIWGVRDVPAELLTWVVDVGCSIEDLAWAQEKYRRDPDLKKRYNDVDYDTEHYRKGTKKAISSGPYTLPRILECGGVCVDQAFFAAMAGKALGMPTAYVTGDAANMGHAWVGYAKALGGRTLEWNFDTGRYDDYDRVKGELRDYQIDKEIADGELAVLADAMTIDQKDRHLGLALVDAAMTLRGLGKGKQMLAWPPAIEGIEAPEKGKARPVTVAAQLELLETSLKSYAASPRAWAFLVTLSKAGELSLKDKERWAGNLDKLCGRKYADFSLRVLVPMVETIENPREQSGLWDSMARSYSSRPDLAGEVKMRQGKMWEKAGEPKRAMDCYRDVVDKYVNDGPFAVGALSAAEKAMKKDGAASGVIPMYEKAFQRTRKPPQTAFSGWSNYNRIGLRLATLYAADGRNGDAERVKRLVLGK